MTEDFTELRGPRRPITIDWDVKTVIAYALSAGAHPADGAQYVYEGAGPQVLASFASALGVRWLPLLARESRTVWGPLILASQHWELHEALPPQGTARCEWQVASLAPAGRNTAVTVCSNLVLDGRRVISCSTTLISRARPPGLSLDAEGSGSRIEPPDSAPDVEVTIATYPQQTAIFRLTLPLDPAVHSTDALHIDPKAVSEAGFTHPPLHGPAVVGVLLRGALAHWTDCSAQSMTTQFRRPLIAGDPVALHFWSTASGVILAADRSDGERLATADIAFAPIEGKRS